ncbi:MAG: hypothetical protein WC735_01420 [Candidatus Paceibacterota bacterium]|jgi:hypothetical protein
MKKPFYFAGVAVAYIVLIVSGINFMGNIMQNQEETIFIPMAMLSLFVLSAAIMGFLFLSEPLQLLIENRRQEAVVFFAKIVGIFACFVAIFTILLFLF